MSQIPYSVLYRHYNAIIREGFNNPSHGNFPLGGGGEGYGFFFVQGDLQLGTWKAVWQAKITLIIA